MEMVADIVADHKFAIAFRDVTAASMLGKLSMLDG
jgi:hypothetical protein